MIFETHAHYAALRFSKPTDEQRKSLAQQGIGTVVNVGSSIETSKACMELADTYDFVYAAIGVHPSDIDCLSEENLTWLKQQAGHKKVVAIGEIGLDYYWDKDASVQQAQRLSLIHI